MLNKERQRSQKQVQYFPFLFLWILVGMVGRLVPHIANVTPLTSMSLLAGAMLSRKQSLLVILVTMLFSDIAIGLLFHYPLFGAWSIFTYSGFALITVFGSRLTLQTKVMNAIGMLVISTLFFWIWTNFGAWLLSGMYPRTISGFWTCYVMALPFLRNALIGSLIWFVVLFSCFRMIRINNVYKFLFQ